MRHDDEKGKGRDEPAAEVATAIHRRWARTRRPWRGPVTDEQCLLCVGYVPLSGPLGADWGVCARAESPQDGKLMFEHESCPAFTPKPHGEPSAQ
ncbi:MAG TPA: DUF3027 domain-containing protein [Thermoanaerobaculia bacterium]|nr:DUF3027 domain-containing protein [Thermoanaerobaculia bacterium]